MIIDWQDNSDEPMDGMDVVDAKVNHLHNYHEIKNLLMYVLFKNAK